MAAPEVVHHIQELSHLANPDFLTALKDLGHPYGLLTTSTNAMCGQSIFCGVFSNEASGGRKEPSPSAEDLSFLYKNSPLFANIVDLSIFGPLYSLSFWALSGYSSQKKSDLDISTSTSEAIDHHLHTNLTYSEERLPFSYMLLPSLLTSKLTVASIIGKGGEPPFKHGKNGTETTALIAPFLAKIAQPELALPRSKELHIDKKGLTFGTASLRLSTYRGTEPFIVKSPDGTPVTEIKPGDPIAHMHISHNAFAMRGLSPIEKARAITEDIIALLSAIDQADPTSLSPEQQQTLAQAKNATIIGISHLVRLFRRATGLPTWKLDVLPEMLQRFHTLDSQAVSNQFGGQRRVKPEDIEMLVITPPQRHQLLAHLS